VLTDVVATIPACSSLTVNEAADLLIMGGKTWAERDVILRRLENIGGFCTKDYLAAVRDIAERIDPRPVKEPPPVMQKGIPPWMFVAGLVGVFLLVR
jgi:hypothetical protein